MLTHCLGVAGLLYVVLSWFLGIYIFPLELFLEVIVAFEVSPL